MNISLLKNNRRIVNLFDKSNEILTRMYHINSLALLLIIDNFILIYKILME